LETTSMLPLADPDIPLTTFRYVGKNPEVR
jgi:hypothetical protein